MENIKVTIDGKEVPLFFDLRAWVEELEPRFGSLSGMNNQLAGEMQPVGAAVDLLVITANAGYRQKGVKDKLTRAWVLDHAQPHEVPALSEAAKAAVMRSFYRDLVEDDADDVDVVAEEILKKNPVSE